MFGGPQFSPFVPMNSIFTTGARPVAAVLLAWWFFSAGAFAARETASAGETVAEIIASPTAFSGDGLEPVEARFSAPVVAETEVNKAVDAAAVLDIKPALPGAKFRWLSARSGVLEPAAPPPLGVEYKIVLKKGFKNTAGRAVSAGSVVTLNSADFAVKEHRPRWFSPEERLSRQPEITLFFNDAVTATMVQRNAAFFADDAQRVAVTASTVLRQELERNAPVTGTWAEQRRAEAKRGGDDVDAPGDAVVVSAVRVKPVKPLPPGKNWRLRLEAGILNASGKAKLKTPYEAGYDTILPLELVDVEAEPGLDGPSRLNLFFNKPLPKWKDGEWREWVEVRPEPAETRGLVNGQTFTLEGNFEPGLIYGFFVREGLPGGDGVVLERGAERTVKFAPHEAVLSLAAFDHAQWIGGTGRFEISSANLRGVSVKVKSVPPETAAFLLNGYAVYQYDEEHPNNPEHTRLPFSAVPGKTVWQKEMTSGAALNRSERFGFNWDETSPDGKRKPGIYFVSVEGRPKEELDSESTLGAQAVVQLTDIGLAWKFAGRECLVYAFSHATGEPLVGVELTSVTAENETLERKTTGADGLARLAFGGAGRWLLARRGEDFRAADFKEGAMPEISAWRFDIPATDADPAGTTREMLFFSERPVYQPGETVFFKAIARTRKGGHVLSLPDERRAKLEVRDPRGRVILKKDVEFSATGTLSDTVELPERGTGWYRLRLTFPKPSETERRDDETGSEDERVEYPGSGWTFEHMVLAQEYQPNAFRIVFDDQNFQKEGETARAPLRASYLMGKPLGRATLKWVARTAPAPFYPGAWEGYRFCHAKSYYVWDGQEYHPLDEERWTQPLLTGQGEVKLSDKGEALIEAKMPEFAGTPGPRRFMVEAEITDLNQQTIAESYVRTEHSSAFYLGVKSGTRAVRQGEETPVSVVAVEPDGKRHAKPVAVKVEVERLVWDAVRVQTAGGGTAVRNSLTFVKAGEETFTVSPEPGREVAWTFKPQTVGTHNLIFSATDDAGRDVKTIVSIDVFGPGEMSWEREAGVAVELVTDKEKYLPGETARVIVKTPLEGTALVTVERERVLLSTVRRIRPGDVIELPVTEEWGPNVFVSVTQVRGGANDPREIRRPEYRVGYCQLRVERRSGLLNVELQPASPEVRPGAMVQVRATVRDATGKPVPNAELALWAVDEGVLSLMPWELPDPYATFHRDSVLFVRSGISLRRLLAENPKELDFANKGFTIGGGGEDDTAALLTRRDFKATAYWHGTLTTGADGALEVTFPAPDNLTEFRLLAVANEGASRFGKGEGKFKVNKPLMIEPALPRFANVGDVITLKAVLHNTTAAEAEVALEFTAPEQVAPLDAESLRPLAERVVRRNARLAAGGSQVVSFPVKFLADGETVFRWTARAAGNPELSDAVEAKFMTGFAEPLLREVRFFTLSPEAGEENLLANVRPELLEGRGDVTVTVSNSRALEGARAVEHLLTYPYGCAEQTASSLLPWLTLRDLKKVIPDLNRPDEEIARMVERGCARLLSMQTGSGGLGYWPGSDEPTLWASAHGTVALVMGARAGAPVPQERLEALLGWLSQALRNAGADFDSWALTERAYAAYALALAGKAEPGYHDLLFQMKERLSPGARALLALAIAESEGPADMVKEVLAARGENETDWWWGGEMSLAVRALALLKIKDPSADEAMGRLMAARGARGDWGNTVTNAWTLLALSREAAMYPPDAGESAVAVTFADQSREVGLPAELTSKTVAFFHPGGGAELPRLTAKVTRGGRFYVQVEIAARQKPGEQPGRNAGFGISRSWQKVNTDGTLAPAEALRAGDLVLVTLKLDVPAPAEYLAIDDPLPATLEGVNPNFTSMASGSRLGVAGSARWLCDFTEMRRDRMLFFRNYFGGRGEFELQYLARVVAEGRVTVPAAKIEMMYDPSRFGLSPSQSLVTEPAPPEEVATR